MTAIPLIENRGAGHTFGEPTFREMIYDYEVNKKVSFFHKIIKLNPQDTRDLHVLRKHMNFLEIKINLPTISAEN
jgi:hypothetical protein